jgi:L-fuconate dehydratase
VAAIRAHRDLVVGWALEDLIADLGAFWRRLAGDSQLRWLGPEKGVVHLAMAAIVNAVWDLYAKAEGKPLWKLLADMSPAEIVRCIDFRYITDVLTPDEALAMLAAKESTKLERAQTLLASGYPAYTTSAGWIGYSDERIVLACTDAIAEGWTHFKVKVGASPVDDYRRVALADDRRQSTVGRRRGHHARARSGGIQPALDRRTHES